MVATLWIMLFVSKRGGGAGVWVGRTVYTGRDALQNWIRTKWKRIGSELTALLGNAWSNQVPRLLGLGGTRDKYSRIQ